jgi:diguanylate cyclase (GGDEF)-like protein
VSQRSTSASGVFPELTIDGRRPVVLMAARSLPIATFGTSVLKAAGFEVETETSGERILAHWGRLRPDLILAEVLLDDMDVVHFCSRLRQLRMARSVPLLVASDLIHAPTIQKILGDDCTDFIAVPIQWQVLVFRAHRWLYLAKKMQTLQEREMERGEVEEARDSALQASTEALRLRHFDSLTGLPNRELFVSTVGLALRQEQSHPHVLLLDIDDFREVNALVGRTLGDELLKVVAKRLRNCLREDESTFKSEGERASFARFGGDQFAVLVLGERNSKQKAMEVAARLLRRLADPIMVGERQFRLNGRVGIADSADLGSEGEEVLAQRAETATRYCKQRTGERVAFFESFMNELVVRRMALKDELRTAIDREQLYLCYQLLVDGRTLAPTSVEGLIRWRHPSRGEVPPEEFLGVAEESELVVEIDRWVLRDGCRQGKLWLDRGMTPLKISLNVSMRFLEEEDFSEQVLSVLRESALPPDRLQLELSERGVLPEAGRILAQLERLAETGIHLAIDDFGTGQTSLSYLRTLPLDCIKVDRSFVSRVPGDSASAAIVSAVAAMSHHLGLRVVAEGVENREQQLFLRSHGYDELQGFLLSRPLPASDVEEVLADLAEQGLRQPEEPESAAEPEPRVAIPVGEAAAAADEARGQRGATGAKAVEERPGPNLGEDTSNRLLRLAHRDFLTGLYNRFSFDERLEHAVAHADRYGHKLALLLIDLDEFKFVNDTHGHPIGDGLLVEIAKRLHEKVRRVDTLARIGGDEFAIIYSEFSKVAGVAEAARRFLAALSEPIYVEGLELRVGGSIGVTVYPEGSSRAEDLLRQADLALYKAKSEGGNRIHFFAREMDRDVQRSLHLARDLGGALERSEFLVKYQPVVDLRTARLEGVEALLRWRHPARGMVDPASFIPVAENTGEIRALGGFVIRQACAQARRWRERYGRTVPVAVNISAVQCREARFADSVVAALEEHRLPPAALQLELSERLLTTLTEELEEPLRSLEALGLGLTLDNFGTGASSLEHFQRFRFQRLKIDRSLVWTVGRGAGSESVLSGIVALAGKLGLTIVAEGIERQEQAEWLLAEGCDLGQGFLFSKPLLGDQVMEILTRRDGPVRVDVPEGDPAAGRHPPPSAGERSR